MELIEETKNKIAIAEKCISMCEKANPMTDEIVWQMQFHKGYLMAMNECLSDLEELNEEIEANGRSLL